MDTLKFSILEQRYSNQNSLIEGLSIPLLNKDIFNLDLFKLKAWYESQTGEPPMPYNCVQLKKHII